MDYYYDYFNVVSRKCLELRNKVGATVAAILPGRKYEVFAAVPPLERSPTFLLKSYCLFDAKVLGAMMNFANS